MTFTCTLTYRHGNKHLDSIYPDVFVNSKNAWKRLEAWFLFAVPDNTTKLVVFMSGFAFYRQHLIGMCRKHGISELQMIYEGGKRKRHINKMTFKERTGS